MHIRLLNTSLFIPFHHDISQEYAAVRKPAYKACLLLIMLLSPAIGHAAGLGRLAINSALGQPFKAEIDLVAVKKEEKSSLTVRLAPQEIFRQANVDYVPLLSTFKASIESRPDGQPYVKIISSQPIADPLLNMLVELNWSSGRLLREYTVVLAPPEIDSLATSPTPATQTVPPVSAKAESAAAEKRGLRTKSPANGGGKTAVPESASANGTHTVYGPVKRGDTLGGIVRNIAPPAGVSFNQMLVALHRANRDAFFGNNMHRLKTGPILRVPDGSEIGAITPAEADQEVKVQTADWNRYRLGEEVKPIPMTEELKQTVSGKIEAAVNSDAAGSQGLPDGFLKVSQGKELGNAGNAGGKDIGRRSLDERDGSGRKEGVQDQIHEMEEDAIANSKSLSEANERIVLLEKNIKELKHLLELKNLASESVLATQHTLPKLKADNLQEATITSLATVESATEIAKPMRTSAKSGREADSSSRFPTDSLLDDLTDNIEYLGGALVLLITGVVGVSIISRPKEESGKNPHVNRVSPVSNLRLDDKEVPLMVTMGADTTTQVDPVAKVDQAVKAGTYLDAGEIQTDKIAGITSAEDHGHLLASEIAAATNTSGKLMNLINSSEAALSASPSPASFIVRSAEAGLGDISFNLGKQPIQPTGVGDRNTHWHEIVTKLDLVRAYQEMGDRDSARQILQEIAREGDAQQQERATLMLANL